MRESEASPAWHAQRTREVEDATPIARDAGEDVGHETG
jgi:hypothetical protein